MKETLVLPPTPHETLFEPPQFLTWTSSSPEVLPRRDPFRGAAGF